MNHETTKHRLSKLREAMKSQGVSAFLLNGADPHLSEYAPDRWKTRSFISGFTGSYGWVAITPDDAALWTDSRYYLQAESELEGTGIVMKKARLPETISVEKWVSERLKKGDCVGFDGSCYSFAEGIAFEKEFSSKSIRMEPDIDLLDKIWDDRPPLPSNKIYEHPLKFAGKTRTQKIEEIREQLKQHSADMQIIAALDDLAWTFNIRGNDVEFNPVTLAYAIISSNEAALFVDKDKMDEPTINSFGENEIEIRPYNEFYKSIENLSGKRVLIDPQRTNFKIYKSVSSRNEIVQALSIPCRLKALKNEAEIDGFRKAMIADGLALLDFHIWLEATIGKQKITEYDIALKLSEVRSKQTGYKGDSFYPIVGYKEHGAIVHYSVTPESASEVGPDGLLLLDTGAQYEFGTTDITRTLGLGNISPQMKKDFTAILKGMIALSKAKFPTGTIGCHLDILVHNALWQHGLHFGHGTSHGIGAHLNVHEGPMSIRLDLNNQPILPGMVLSNEPGAYRNGQYGIRTENVMLCVQDEENEFGNFSRFETLTLYPIDVNMIDISLLNTDEVLWINNYHAFVLEMLLPYTNAKQLELLKQLTNPI